MGIWNDEDPQLDGDKNNMRCVNTPFTKLEQQHHDNMEDNNSFWAGANQHSLQFLDHQPSSGRLLPP